MSIYEFDTIANRQGRTFRLFKLQAGFGNDKIEGEILIRRLRSNPGSHSDGDDPEPEKYDALSYCWGAQDAEKDPSITIRKLSKSFKHQITRNLYSALDSLREPRRDIFLWIDAICIDQRNTIEKSSQISSMSTIYIRAESVRVWLGERDDCSDIAFAFIRQCLDAEVLDQMMEDPNASKSWNALWSLMRRPWFSRRWIVQEIAMARSATLHCSRELIPWGDFAEVVSQLPENQEKLRDLFIKSPDFKHHPDHLGDITELGAIRLVDATDELFRRSAEGQILEKKSSLEEVICMISVFETSDPHDVIYAILSLANDAHAAHAFVEPELPSTRPSSPRSPRETSPRQINSHKLAFDPATYIEAETAPTGMDRHDSIHFQTSMILPNHDALSPMIQLNGDAENRSVINGGAATHQAVAEELLTDGSPIDSPIAASNHCAVTGPGTVSASSRSTLAVPSSIKRKRSLSSATNPEERAQVAFHTWRDSLKKKSYRLDYGKSIYEICKELLIFTITRSGSLDILCRPWAPDDPKDKKFPTWICPMHRVAFAANDMGVYRRVNADPLLGKSTAHHSAYKAAPPRSSAALPRFSERSLTVRGFTIDVIQHQNIMRSATSGTVPADWKSAAEWDGRSLPPDSFWRTLVGDRTAQGRRAPSYWRRACLNAFIQGPRNHDLETSDTVMHYIPSSTRAYVQRLRSVIWNRRLLRMDNAVTSLTFSLVPEETRDGDLICIIYGCNVPVVLRKVPNRSHPVYSLIGECYVHGAMDGEGTRVRAKIIEDLKKDRIRKAVETFDQEFELI